MPTTPKRQAANEAGTAIGAATIEPKVKKRAVDRRTTPGVWVHYLSQKVRSDSPDGPLDVMTPIAVSVHADQLEARIAAMDAEVTGKVVFVPWDATILAAIGSVPVSGEAGK